MLGSLLLAIIWMSPPLPLGHDASLHWTQRQGAEACIGERELATAVAARLGGAPDHGGASRVVIDGEIAPSGSGWTAAIRTTNASGEVLGQRELREPASDCRAIDDKLVLVIALIVDPDLLDKPPATPHPTAVSTPAAPWRFGAGIAGLVARGLLPGFGFGTALAVAIEPPRFWPIEIDATLWPHDRGLAPPGGATFLQLTGGAALCPPLGARISACVGAQVGELRARGFGYDQNELEHELVVDATAELRLTWALTPAIRARIGAGAWVPFSRPRFVFREAGSDVLVYQPPFAALVTEIALSAHF